jgi:hypothetical protein
MPTNPNRLEIIMTAPDKAGWKVTPETQADRRFLESVQTDLAGAGDFASFATELPVW